MSLKQWLNKSYPLIQKPKDKALLLVGFSLFTWVFLLIYQPFGAAEITENRSLFLMGFGLMVAMGLFITYFLVPRWFSRIFDGEKWQIKKEILFILLSLLVIAILNYLYNSQIGATFAPQHSLAEFVGITVSVGIFPIIGMVYLVERFLSRQNQSRADQLNSRIDKPESLTEKQMLQIQSESSRAKAFTLNLDDFLFASSDNNYVIVHYLENKKLKKELIRLSMRKLEQQLSAYSEIKRCHRSYMVNKEKVVKFKGNARSLTLELEQYDLPIPVARSMAKDWLD
ncbi:MAG: LytTR family transcriptional regulator DNA-binding domain-containing protein [Bacteroidia bacterium]|nr:LytTR family transcriptional regulator DNA-binding domain-containing protein [Bacteroidia bacterium]